MGNKISNSQVNKYQQCGMSYKFYYVDKIRPTKLHSALLFGGSFDKASDVILQPQKYPNTTAEKVFDDTWMQQDINGVRTYIPDNIELVYAQNDFDKDLITKNDLQFLGISKDDMLALVTKRKEVGYNALEESDQAMVNKIFWCCLKHKGHYFLDALRTKIMPKITKVLSTQEYIELDNGTDTLIGYIDAVLEIEGYERPIVVDIKTSSMNYDPDSVEKSQQLSLYTNAVSEKYNTNTAAYIVFNKNLIKNKKKICTKCKHDGSGKAHKTCPNEMGDGRCNGAWDETISPEVFTQFIISAIPPITTDIVMENFDAVNSAITAKVFTRNLTVCENMFGRPCDYINLCYKNKMDGLKKKEE